MSDTNTPSLYEWAGGSETLGRMIEMFYKKIETDSILSSVFAQMNPKHAQYVTEFIAEVLGGPKNYSQNRGGHPHMIAQHLGRSLTQAQRQHWVNLLVSCADEIGLPDDPEFRSALVAYLEWGSRLAVINSQPGASINPDAPMPIWGWGEVKGPYKR